MRQGKTIEMLDLLLLDALELTIRITNSHPPTRNPTRRLRKVLRVLLIRQEPDKLPTQLWKGRREGNPNSIKPSQILRIIWIELWKRIHTDILRFHMSKVL